jgi:predicted DNA-binding protein (MmcQ/YjbR family)
VELVHEDYYERGVDHSSQMEVEKRSAPYQEAIRAVQLEGALQISMTDSLAVRCDSARIQLYRPSDNHLDMNMKYDPGRGALLIDRADLVPGRYILKLSWYSGGLKYEVDRSLNIQ